VDALKQKKVSFHRLNKKCKLINVTVHSVVSQAIIELKKEATHKFILSCAVGFGISLKGA
jgi:hypothetical protein